MAKEPAKLADLTRRHLEPVRCPYCVQGNEFKLMVDLTGGVGGTFYCTACRHLFGQANHTSSASAPTAGPWISALQECKAVSIVAAAESTIREDATVLVWDDW